VAPLATGALGIACRIRQVVPFSAACALHTMGMVIAFMVLVAISRR
jgi:hypothetical protein